MALQNNNKLPECIHAYKQALKLDPTDEDARQNLQRALKQQKQQEEKKDNKENKEKKKPREDQKQKEKEKQAKEIGHRATGWGSTKDNVPYFRAMKMVFGGGKELRDFLVKNKIVEFVQL